MDRPLLPKPSDFPSDRVVTLIPPPNNARASNILILCHGLGDTQKPFAGLGSNLALPETACLAIQGPTPLPLELEGFHWGDDVVFDQGSGSLDADAGFTKSHALLREIVEDILVTKCGWARRSVFFFGYGQGGMACCHFVLEMSRVLVKPDDEYGGVISIGGPVPSASRTPREKVRTPLLLLGAERRSAVTESAELRARNVFETVNVVRWRGRVGDGMMKNREEAVPIMQFFGRRLQSRAGVPDDAVEVAREI